MLDYDIDGLLDIFIPSQDYGSIMYHNLGIETLNNWIGFDLWGTQSARDPLGTLVTIYAGDKQQTRYTKAATTWKIQDNPFVHFGIGQATGVDSIVIRWPLGDVQVLTGLAINQYHKVVELGGTGVADNKAQSTTNLQNYDLAQNYPNPFNSETRINYHLPTSAKVMLGVFNLSGQKVAVLANGNQDAGNHIVDWTGEDDTNNPLPSGIYLYQLRTNDVTLIKKMLFVR
jgi:hypothetical protein